MNISVLIPAYKPDARLVSFVKSLANRPFKNIVIIDDGSGVAFEQIFEELKKVSKTVVVNHEKNQGKGAALKTGFDYIYSHLPKCAGIVTADADGQHREDDIMTVASTHEKQPDSFILGARTFTSGVPLRSRIGNSSTRLLFKHFFKLNISDTQTGLRVIPRAFVPALLKIPYNRYEYEAEMLLVGSQNKLNILEVPIETVYEDNNSSSHFNPLIDSMKIYFILFRYVITSIVTALVDYVIFIQVYPFTKNVFTATFISRFFALFINYLLLRNYVFHSRQSANGTFPKYVMLVIVSGMASSLLIEYIVGIIGASILFAKIVAELLIYGFNFLAQKTIVFKSNIHE
ncbi:MAG: bifunctional glycosyltransferase family 2/GtrA family protein [Candidatus Taylorbacteria bacterium]